MSERKRISDEIREWGIDTFSGDEIRAIKELRDLADRIDREMVELPRDCGGVPIHVGDTVWLKDGRVALVDVVKFMQERDVHIKCWTGYQYTELLPEEVARARPDSLGRIADELDEMADAARHADDTCERLAGLAERLRLLAKEDER
ncbi:hypothetical protein ACTM8Z_00125 [Atopobiaceae bacterium HCP3S3_D6]